MRATATPITAPRQRDVLTVLDRLSGAAATVLSTIGRACRAFAEAGQLGPSESVTISRHTGARI